MNETANLHGNAKHGHASHQTYTPTYISWRSMRDRCKSPKHNSWKNYGGRGITICERWNSYENFLADMGERPPATSLDRIDPNGNYEPSNCRWATKSAQERNRRHNHFLTFNGVTKLLIEWAEEYKIDPDIVRDRIRRGGTVEHALMSPIQARPIEQKERALDGYPQRRVVSRRVGNDSVVEYLDCGHWTLPGPTCKQAKRHRHRCRKCGHTTAALSPAEQADDEKGFIEQLAAKQIDLPEEIQRAVSENFHELFEPIDDTTA